MAVKYHVNPETGRANICRAEKQCPLKDVDGKPAEHFTDKAKAKAHGEKMLASIHGATKTLKKDKTSDKKPLNKTGKKVTLNVPKGMTPMEAKRVQEANIKLTNQQGHKIYSAKPVEAITERRVGEADAIGAKFLDKGRTMSENKQMLIDYIADDSNYEKVKEDFKNAGYDADNSAYIQNLRKGNAGANSILRQAQKDAITANNNGSNITVSDVLIYADEASEEYYDSIGADRFSSDRTHLMGTEEVDIDEIEEAPEFLKDDPDFFIDEDEGEFEEDEK